MGKTLSKRRIFVIFLFSLAVFFTLMVADAPTAIILIASGTAAAALATLLGVPWVKIHDDLIQTIAAFIPAILILMAVGMLISSWILCGTIPFMIYYGLKLVSPSFFLLTSLFLCTIMSVATGTSWGTIGTIGIALTGISTALGIPLPQTAGAVVTGAIFGDKLSPLSDTTVLASAVSEVYIFDHIKYMLWTTLPPYMIAVFLFGFLGVVNQPSAIAAYDLNLIMITLEESFHLGLILLIPPAVVLFLVLRKKPVLPTFAAGISVALVLAVFCQGSDLEEISRALYGGYKNATAIDLVDNMLLRGGITSMLGSIILPIAAAIFGSPLRSTGIIEVLLEAVSKVARDKRIFMAGVFLTHALFFMITASYYVTFAAFGPLVAPLFDKFKLHRANLSRLLEDTGTTFAPIIPWSVTGAFIAGTLGVSTWDYFFFVPLAYLGLIFSLGYIVTGFRIAAKEAP
ncbi:MAG: Na+/H+ antiporter NhaC [Thermovirgaceae bacterium]